MVGRGCVWLPRLPSEVPSPEHYKLLSRIFRTRLACQGALRGACNALLAPHVGAVATSRLGPDGGFAARAV